MRRISPRSRALLMITLLASAAPAGLSAQSQGAPDDKVMTTVVGTPEEAPAIAEDIATLPKGPVVEGYISARSDTRLQVTTVDGSKTVVSLADATRIKGKGGFLGLSSSKLAANQLLNGLPVSVRTVQGSAGLVASQIDLKSKDLKTAAMIRNGTEQGFAEQTAATEALRGRVGDIDQYNIKGVVNVNFDTGKAVLSEQDKAELCQTAQQAESVDNALLLVIGYTDSTGGEDLNQALSEKRAAKVVNYLQQACGWKPYRMLTPTGMAEADPAADNSTEEGKALNRRVAVNIMVSKGLDGI